MLASCLGLLLGANKSYPSAAKRVASIRALKNIHPLSSVPHIFKYFLQGEKETFHFPSFAKEPRAGGWHTSLVPSFSHHYHCITEKTVSVFHYDLF